MSRRTDRLVQKATRHGILCRSFSWPAETISGSQAFIHPAFEQRHVILRPRFQGSLLVGRKIEPVALHCLNVGSVTGNDGSSRRAISMAVT